MKHNFLHAVALLAMASPLSSMAQESKVWDIE